MYIIWYSGGTGKVSGGDILLHRKLSHSLVYLRHTYQSHTPSWSYGHMTITLFVCMHQRNKVPQQINMCPANYNALDSVLRGVPPHDELVILDDFNATYGLNTEQGRS